MRIVLAVDGSPVAARAARFVARLASRLAEKPEVILLHVDEPLLQSVAIHLGVKGVEKYHADNGKFALKTAKATLNRADVAYDEQLLVGDPADTIVKYASSAKCDLVVMGSHGRGALTSLFLGSITIKVLTHCAVPVTIVR
ncbi:universal stress protein [Lysobacter koreensis]|uniref:Universal stress protein n=1 Tax=Lysobacter koreensis TaxID=266122 RepID=A0ABW2YK75_9GAMM